MVRKNTDSFNMTDILKCFCALLVHATPDGKVSVSKAVLDQMPSNFGSIMEVKDLGDRYFIRILGMDERKIALPKHGIILPSGRNGPRDTRPVIRV